VSKLNRRQFLKGASALPATGAAGMLLTPSAMAEAGGFDRPLPLTLMQGNDSEIDDRLNVLEGSLPDDIHGHAFIMESLNTEDNIAIIAGKGAISRVDFVDGEARLFRRNIKTPSAIAREELKDTRYKFLKLGGLAYLNVYLGVANFCNTAFAHIGNGRMAITYDAGQPYEIDPVSLKVITPIGKHSDWKTALPNFIGETIGKTWPFRQVQSSAHPFYDPESGDFITINFGGKLDTRIGAIGTSFARLMLWDTFNHIRKINIVDDEGKPIVLDQAVHSLCVTRNHIIVFSTPFTLEAESMFGSRLTKAQPWVTPAWVIRRDEIGEDGSSVTANQVILEREWQHVMANYDDSDGIITLYAASSPAEDLSEILKAGDVFLDGTAVPKVMHGMKMQPMDRGECARIRIEVGADSARLLDIKKATNDTNGWGISLQAYNGDSQHNEQLKDIYWASFGINPLLMCRRMLTTYKDYPLREVELEDLPTEPVNPTLFRFDCENVAIADSWVVPDGYFLSSPQFAPKRGAQAGDSRTGYLICTASSDLPREGSSGDEIWIFDGEDLAQGPVCKLGHDDVRFALTLHTTWSESLESQNGEHYKILPEDDYGHLVWFKPRLIRDLIKNKIYPAFK
jgi:carotenoid cleavage dioxygenase-like enzyme